MKRRLISLLLVLLLCSVIPLSAAADAYIPPERIDGFDMNYAYMEDGTCKALNVFVSNFAEVGIPAFSEDTPHTHLIAAVLKHLELNAQYYPAYVTQITADDGSPFMRISGEFFEERMEHLFGIYIPATECPGYADGYIEVSADHFGGPIQVFASVYGCYPMGGDVYEVMFDVFRIDTDFSGWYTTAYGNLPWDNLTTLGTGTAIVKYPGGKTNESISTSDFTLLDLQMDVKDLPCRGANVPYGYEEPTEPAETAAPTEAEPETEAPTEPSSVPETEPETKPAFRNEKEEEEEQENPVDADAEISISLVLIILLVVAVVLLALLIIVFLIIKKKQP